MKEFMLLFRGSMVNEEVVKASPEQLQAQMALWNTWMGEIARQGKLMGGQPLAAGGKTVSGLAKKLTDGPFIEGKDIVGGYLIVKAIDYPDAVEISKGCPILNSENGSVEIREIMASPI